MVVVVVLVLVMGQTLLSLIVPHRADVPTRAVVTTDWHFHGKTCRTWSYWVRHSLTIVALSVPCYGTIDVVFSFAHIAQLTVHALIL
jgi:hypothetical protein